jgi:hypothetical protein
MQSWQFKLCRLNIEAQSQRRCLLQILTMERLVASVHKTYCCLLGWQLAASRTMHTASLTCKTAKLLELSRSMMQPLARLVSCCLQAAPAPVWWAFMLCCCQRAVKS